MKLAFKPPVKTYKTIYNITKELSAARSLRQSPPSNFVTNCTYSRRISKKCGYPTAAVRLSSQPTACSWLDDDNIEAK